MQYQLLHGLPITVFFCATCCRTPVCALHRRLHRTRIFVSTKLTAPTLFTWAPLVLAFSYIYSGNDSTGAEVTICSGEDTAGIILAPKKDEVELGRWTAEEKNSLQSLIVTNKRVAFRTYAKFLCVTRY